MRTKYVTVDGTAIHYFHGGPSTLPGVIPDLGRGEVLLFLHGAGSNGHTWHRQVTAFSEEHSPLAFDFPAHGRSGGTESLGSIAAYRDCVVALMQALDVRPCVVVGRSMGGAVAMALALSHPDSVRALVLVATAACFDLPATLLETWKNVMLGRAQQPFTTDSFSPKTDFSLMREIWMEQVKTDPRVRYHDLVACTQFDVRQRLAAIGVPTLIVAGRDDQRTPMARAEELQRGITGSELVIIDDAGHHVGNEKAEEFNAVLSRFVRELAPGARTP
jgi:pimeloyl-ACP methyl ester carboxylesterase